MNRKEFEGEKLNWKKNGRERNCMNELAWTMEINRASNGQEVNVRVQVALNVRANLLLVLHLKPFKTIILQFVIRLATNSGFTFVFFSLLLCLFLSFFFFANFNSEWTWTWCTVATEAWQNKTKHAYTRSKEWERQREREWKKCLNKSWNSTRVVLALFTCHVLLVLN